MCRSKGRSEITKGLGSCLEALYKLQIGDLKFPPELKRPVFYFLGSLLKVKESGL